VGDARRGRNSERIIRAALIAVVPGMETRLHVAIAHGRGVSIRGLVMVRKSMDQLSLLGGTERLPFFRGGLVRAGLGLRFPGTPGQVAEEGAHDRVVEVGALFGPGCVRYS